MFKSVSESRLGDNGIKKSFTTKMNDAIIVIVVFLITILLPAPTEAAENKIKEEIIIEEGFEGEIPEFHTYNATYETDEKRVHSGKYSLRVTPSQEGKSGGAYFKLGDLINSNRDFGFSTWVFTEKDGSVNFYISASDGEKRHMKASAIIGKKPGEWIKITGFLRGKDCSDADKDFMLAMMAIGKESWFDDVMLWSVPSLELPVEMYPKIEKILHTEADKRLTRIDRDSGIFLNASSGVLAPDIASIQVMAIEKESATIPADGFFVFALEAKESMYVTGNILLLPDNDIRPGLRVYILCDSTLIAAPMVAASGWATPKVTDPAPFIEGIKPPERVNLAEWFLSKGKHYLMVAGPHFRPGGIFQGLEIKPTGKLIEKPLYQFVLLSDLHITKSAPSQWMNMKMGSATSKELADTLKALRKENVNFALISADMTDAGTSEEFTMLADILNDARLPCYGCIGNHDAMLPESRNNALNLLPDLFPGGSTNYFFVKPPLRFVVSDYESSSAEWLRKVLADDTATPTVVMRHFCFYNRGGKSSCGYQMPVQSNPAFFRILQKAPNVIAALNGHAHWDEVNVVKNITVIQVAAFCEWPNSYRIFRVCPDRIEWETRQVSNRGFVRESFIVEKAMSWMISTGNSDLTGQISIRPAEQ